LQTAWIVSILLTFNVHEVGVQCTMMGQYWIQF